MSSVQHLQLHPQLSYTLSQFTYHQGCTTGHRLQYAGCRSPRWLGHNQSQKGAGKTGWWELTSQRPHPPPPLAWKSAVCRRVVWTSCRRVSLLHSYPSLHHSVPSPGPVCRYCCCPWSLSLLCCWWCFLLLAAASPRSAWMMLLKRVCCLLPTCQVSPASSRSSCLLLLRVSPACIVLLSEFWYLVVSCLVVAGCVLFASVTAVSQLCVF